jgi:hypothetical protein
MTGVIFEVLERFATAEGDKLEVARCGDEYFIREPGGEILDGPLSRAEAMKLVLERQHHHAPATGRIGG